MTVRFVAILAVAHAVSIAYGRPAACAVTAPTTGAASLLLDPLSLSHGMGVQPIISSEFSSLQKYLDTAPQNWLKPRRCVDDTCSDDVGRCVSNSVDCSR